MDPEICIVNKLPSSIIQETQDHLRVSNSEFFFKKSQVNRISNEWKE